MGLISLLSRWHSSTHIGLNFSLLPTCSRSECGQPSCPIHCASWLFFSFLFSHPTYKWKKPLQNLLSDCQMLSVSEKFNKQSFSGKSRWDREERSPGCSLYLSMAWGLSKMEQNLETCDLAQNLPCSHQKTRNPPNGNDLWEFTWGG